MRFNQKSQYAVLFALYLAKTERARISDAAEALGLAQTFLEQIARKLRIAGIITVVRGPGGGCSLNGNPTLLDVVKAVEPLDLVPNSELHNTTDKPERTAFKHIVKSMQAAIEDELSFGVCDIAAARNLNLRKITLQGYEAKHMGLYPDDTSIRLSNEP